MEKNENAYTRPSRSSGSMREVAPGCDDSLQLAMVYSPHQSWRMLLSPEDALAHGTLFEELYKPLREVCDD
jgi:hypothetical protein